MIEVQLASIFVLGLVVGSFLNVCIYRLPTGDLFKSSRSFCPHCRKQIGWFDNIPVLSYLILRGKCRSCRKPISILYPLVELTSSAIFVGFYRHFMLGDTHPAVYVVYLVLALALVVSTFIDLKLRIIPNEITITGVLLAPLASVIVPQLHDGPMFLSIVFPPGTLPAWIMLRGNALLACVFSIIVGGGSIYLLGVVGKVLFKKDAMGGGDVKLMGMLGGLLGWKMVLATFFIAPFLAIPFGLVSMARTKDHVIAYGPFLSAAAIAVMLWEEPMFAWFVSRMG